MGGEARHLWFGARFGASLGISLRAALLLPLVLLVTAAPAQANSRYAAIVVDAVTGEVLHESRADRTLYPASLTKIMTLYMTFKAIDEGRLRLDQNIPISKRAAGQAPSKLGLPAGSSIRVEDAIYALVTKSANDIATALAEAIGGTEWRFAQLMTEQARRLGMTKTTFRNANGLPDSGQVSTARDMATLAQAVLRDFPERYRYFGTERWSYRGTTYRNHNRLINTYRGMDGFKTGYIRASGFNLVASAVRGNLRLIAVVFGGTTANRRNARVAELLDAAFASARGKHLIAHGQNVFRPLDPPLPPRRPAPDAPVLVAAAPPAPAPGPTDPLSAGVPLPPNPPAAVESPHRDLSLVALSAGEISLTQGGMGGDIATPADWGIQVGAFADRAAGRRALAIARSLLPEVLDGTEPRLMEVHTTQGRLYRARLTGLNQDSAAHACSQLARAGTACLAIAPEAAF